MRMITISLFIFLFLFLFIVFSVAIIECFKTLKEEKEFWKRWEEKGKPSLPRSFFRPAP